MSEAARKPEPAEADPDPYAEREAFRRRLAEQGIIIQLPAGGEWTLDHPLPVPADELSDMVVRLRRGDA